MKPLPATVRAARPSDAASIHRLIAELAAFEKLSHQFVGTESALSDHLFGERPVAEALVAEREGVVIGYALFFTTYSTFRCQPGVWMEDLYVTPLCRAQGIGSMLFDAVQALATDRGCGRMEWSVLDWNSTAIAFYEARQAIVMPDWRICRRQLGQTPEPPK